MQQQVKNSAELVRPEVPGARELGWFADAFAAAKRNRTTTGDRISALVRGPDAAQGAGQPLVDVGHLLAELRNGSSDGPVPLLGRTYRRQWGMEQQMWRALLKRLELHPAWQWLRQIGGIDPLAVARLLARLDPTRASTPSAFWAYCGFATVPGVEYRCSACGWSVACAVAAPPPSSHRVKNGRKVCRGALHRSKGPEQGIRVAQPKAGEDQRGAYDQAAKAACVDIGNALLEAGGSYAKVYHEERHKLDTTRRGWPSPRKHVAALRKMEKLFLSHLWLVWREALDLPLTEPYSDARGSTPAPPSPWTMVDRIALLEPERSNSDEPPQISAAGGGGDETRSVMEGAA